jgi:nickel-dependent lactate racemase
MTIGKGLDIGYLATPDVQSIIRQGLDELGLDGKRMLVIIPDTTRTMPMPMVFDTFEQVLQGRVECLDYLVALGTHSPLDDKQLTGLVGCQVQQGCAGNSRIFNHAWEDPDTYCRLGIIPAHEIFLLTQGLLYQDVPVKVNKLIKEYDQLIICGPVFPHEVAGFSGGNKYFFPGIAGPEIINMTHWLGALITSSAIIGTAETPVRAVIERAASLISTPAACFAFVVVQGGVAGLYFGPVKDAWKAATRLSAKRHVVYKARPFRRVLSLMPRMYTDIWTAAKGMYKVEPVIADGGEVIIYAPHINEVSYSHGKLLDEIGYHCRDYFLSQWDQFKNYPGGVLAHSTHLKGLGSYDLQNRLEKDRIQVILATGIPQERCQRLNLGYLDPASIDIATWERGEDEGLLVVHDAGEVLYRLKFESCIE